jgi:hypothetical protein
MNFHIYIIFTLCFLFVHAFMVEFVKYIYITIIDMTQYAVARGPVVAWAITGTYL